MIVVYIAGPFRGPNAWAIECNIRKAEALALELWLIPGVAVICPHTNNRFFQGSAPDDHFLDGAMEIMLRSDVVFMCGRWQDSEGAKAERMLAERTGIPVIDSIADLKHGVQSGQIKRRKG